MIYSYLSLGYSLLEASEWTGSGILFSCKGSNKVFLRLLTWLAASSLPWNYFLNWLPIVLLFKGILSGFRLKVTLLDKSGESKDTNLTPHMNEHIGFYLTKATYSCNATRIVSDGLKSRTFFYNGPLDMLNKLIHKNSIYKLIAVHNINWQG